MDATTQNSEGSGCTTQQPALLVIRGVLPHDRTAHLLSGQRTTLGRDSACILRLDFPNVSRQHAEIAREGPIFAVKDLSSTNGTYVDGARIRHCVLRAGMLVRVGHWLGIVDELPALEVNRPFEKLSTDVFGGPLLARAFHAVRAFATTDHPIALIGGPGVGKQSIARALHEASGRTGAFHALKCAALDVASLESELSSRCGPRSAAAVDAPLPSRAGHRGTLFLDDVSELDATAQAIVARAMENASRNIGDASSPALDARFVVSVPAPLDELVSAGKLRQDLAACLRGAAVRIPSLSERRGDIPGLFQALLVRHSGGHAPRVSTRCYERLCLQEWPGGVRELEIVTRRLLTLHGLEPVLRTRHAAPELRRAPESFADAAGTDETRREHDLRRFMKALGEVAGNVKLAAQKTGISRQRAYRLMKWSAENDEGGVSTSESKSAPGTSA